MKQNGFTLIEVMMAITILLMVAATGFQVIRAESARFQGLAASLRAQVDTNVLLAQMAKDLRAAYLSADNEQSFFVSPDGKTVSFTRRVADIDIEAVEQINFGPKQDMSFEFFDGQQWKSNWGWDAVNKKPLRGIRGLPLCVRVKVTCADGASDERILPIMTSVLNRASVAPARIWRGPKFSDEEPGSRPIGMPG